ncbi:MAG: hypothetical protein JZU62_04470 [Sulfuricurvum sp.]|uniref:hypothetical protein n=1 Tax=Sulfuricurvum sp. TaxID=2025608 RepID=UPI0025E3A4CF|nr:hypothetical protein [Sulfuricurvum sp.]MBV5320918.1 hypothetical protein [Sulfuricurvum sp.]
MKALALLFCLIGQILIAEPSVLTEPAPSVEATADQNPSSEINTLFSGVSSSTGLKLEFTNLPEHPYVGEIIALNIKLTPVDVASGNIEYTLQNEEGIRIFSDTPKRSVKEDGIYDTFYFLVQSASVRFPDITAMLTTSGATSETLTGTAISATTLSPPTGFANVLADKFEVINYKTTPYNNESNVVIFTVKALRCNLSDFSIPNAIKQGFESKLSNVGESQMTYYAIIPNTDKSLSFSYFNLKKQRYEALNIPIVVDDDTVSTGQSDLSPTDARHTELKISAAGVFVAILFGLFYWRRNKWYIYISVLPMFYIVYVLLPNQNLCIKKDAPVYLLPIKNGTIFEMTLQEEHLEAEKEVGEFVKIHLSNDKVGWVNKRDICTN